MNRQYQFAQMYYDWIIDCLTEDEKFEELAFFRLGVDLCVRLHELKDIKWEQIEYPYVNNIKGCKIKKDSVEHGYYEPREISMQTYNSLNVIENKQVDGFVFQNNSYHYIGSISESIGTNFNGHEMRNIGAILKTAIMLKEEGE